MKLRTLKDNKVKTGLENWINIGNHPTPRNILEDFFAFLNDLINGKEIVINKSNNINLLDLFAGDGRIGLGVEKLLKQKELNVLTSFVEIYPPLTIKPKMKLIKTNVFNWMSPQKFDCIVMNPPYLSINSQQAENFNVEWSNIKNYGSNLYSLSIIQALELLKPNGVLLAITPFGWLRNEKYQKFRKYLKSNCTKIIVRAYDKRNSFEGVNQDIAFQAFFKRNDNKVPFSFYFGYNGFSHKLLNISEIKTTSSKKHSSYINVFVGPVVWNRNKKNLSSKKKGNIPLVYGGNIVSTNKLVFGTTRYCQRQYFKKNMLQKDFLIKSPVILIRRTLRGKPGSWQVDSCLVEKKFIFTAENHVIVIKLSDKIKNKQLFFTLINSKIQEYYKISGNATISTKRVRQISQNILKQYSKNISD